MHTVDICRVPYRKFWLFLLQTEVRTSIFQGRPRSQCGHFVGSNCSSARDYWQSICAANQLHRRFYFWTLLRKHIQKTVRSTVHIFCTGVFGNHTNLQKTFLTQQTISIVDQFRKPLYRCISCYWPHFEKIKLHFETGIIRQTPYSKLCAAAYAVSICLLALGLLITSGGIQQLSKTIAWAAQAVCMYCMQTARCPMTKDTHTQPCTNHTVVMCEIAQARISVCVYLPSVGTGMYAHAHHRTVTKPHTLTIVYDAPRAWFWGNFSNWPLNVVKRYDLNS